VVVVIARLNRKDARDARHRNHCSPQITQIDTDSIAPSQSFPQMTQMTQIHRIPSQGCIAKSAKIIHRKDAPRHRNSSQPMIAAESVSVGPPPPANCPVDPNASVRPAQPIRRHATPTARRLRLLPVILSTVTPRFGAHCWNDMGCRETVILSTTTPRGDAYLWNDNSCRKTVILSE